MQNQISEQTVAIQSLTEQIALMNTRAFGKKSEKLQLDEEQLNFFAEIFNEAEDLMDFDSKVIEHTLTDEQFAEHFPDEYKRLPDEVYRKLELIPAVFEAHEHHITV